MNNSTATQNANLLSFEDRSTVAAGLDVCRDFFGSQTSTECSGKPPKALTHDQRLEVFRMLEPKVGPVVQAVRTWWMIGDRAFGLGDFFAICESENIALCDSPEFERFAGELQGINGCLMRLRGRSVIWLRSFFEPTTGEEMLRVALHELGHYFLQHKQAVLAYHADARWRRVINELEADLFSELCRTGRIQ
jgi:hypothetical protein